MPYGSQPHYSIRSSSWHSNTNFMVRPSRLWPEHPSDCSIEYTDLLVVGRVDAHGTAKLLFDCFDEQIFRQADRSVLTLDGLI